MTLKPSMSGRQSGFTLLEMLIALVVLGFLMVALTQGGPGISTTFPANYVYDLMFQRGQIAIGAAASIMMLLALAVVLVPYALWTVWRSRREAARG